MASQTVPCQYKTGEKLGSGAFAVVKKAIHITTGKQYACKIFDKEQVEGYEHMICSEIEVLKRVANSHPNIVTLHDYFESAIRVYLCLDLCTGGDLLDRVEDEGCYHEGDAAALIRTIMNAVQHLHAHGIVHRNLKLENLLRTKRNDADIMIAGFGSSQIVNGTTSMPLTEIYGTLGYMAPEIVNETGHSKPVDIWAMGVITYFLLGGYLPFDRDSEEQEVDAIINGDYNFEPAEYWVDVSPTARDFIGYCLNVDPIQRPTAAQCLEHKWLASEEPHFAPESL